MKIRPVFPLLILLMLVSAVVVYAWTALPVVNDPLVRMPGTQPGAVTLEDPSCSCHDSGTVPPLPNWQGSMMAQAGRDFLFWAAMTMTAQDSIWAVGDPNATDICERCHFPQGWLEGRSDPTNASNITGSDYDGVHCDVCHSMFDPFFEATYDGTREGNDWINYWDEANNTGPGSGTAAQTAADATYSADAAGASGILYFNGSQFYDLSNSPPITYTENGGGQYFVLADVDKHKRASFADANNPSRHDAYYSRYHKSKYFCGTCHDVSNPVLANLGQDGTDPLTTETDPAFSYFHVERTFSEFMLSDYGLPGGSEGIGPYAPSMFDTSLANNYIARCQDCHMPDVQGSAANQGLDRPSESTEHPNSGQPLHDMTGGNIWVSYVLASADRQSDNHDATNEGYFDRNFLTLDLGQGLGIDPDALLAGVDRAKQQLLQAASIRDLSYSPSSGDLSFQVYNHTGHKLISGFPEGRRMFVNIKAYDAEGNLVQEVNPYDETAGTLKGLEGYTYTTTVSPPAALAAHEVYSDPLVYEVHPSSDLTGEDETFHMALSTGRYKDNRIPPKGFRINEATARLAEPVWHGSSDLNYFSAAEYAGGYDDVSMTIEPGASYVEVNLYYQTTSREFVEFLRDEINGNATILTSPTPSGEASAYIIQSDSFFAELKGWGDTVWDLWVYNRNVPGAAPFLMTQATVGGGTGPGGVGDKDGLSSLTVWLDADAGVTADGSYFVSDWADQSGNGSDATQATGGQQPLLVASTLNGQPVLRFDGSNDSMSLGDLSSSFPNTATLFVVTTISDTSYNLYTTQNNDTWWRNEVTGRGQWGLFRTASVSDYPDPMPSSGSHIFSLVSNDSTYQASQNGTLSGAQSARFAAGTAHQIGAPDDGTAAKYLNGDMAEIIIFNDDLNSAQMALVENYLSAKYNIALDDGDLYAGDTTEDFDFNMAGIGREADGSNIMAHSAGMTLWDRDFLADAGDYLLFGHNVVSNDNVTADLPNDSGLGWDGTGDQRWARSWYISVTDANSNGGTVDIIFDFEEAGMSGNPSYGAENYRLLKRTGATGSFTDITSVSGATVAVYDDRVVFRGVDVGELGSNFTLGTVDLSSSPTLIKSSKADVQEGVTTLPGMLWFGLVLAVAMTSLTIGRAKRRA